MHGNHCISEYNTIVSQFVASFCTVQICTENAALLG